MAQPGVNRAELRTLVQGAFSAQRIIELGTAWGLAPPPEWARSATEAAHGLVRDGEKKLGIQECLRRLRAAEPLIEWPNVDDDASAEWGPPSARAADPETTVVATPDAIRAAAAPAPTVDGAPASVAPSSSASAPPSKAERPAPMLPFPGTEATEPRRNGIDPKIVLAIGGVVLAIAVVAFGAGLLWSRGSASSGASAASASSSARIGPALLAAGLLEHHVVDVASRCSVPYEEGSSRDVLGMAIVLCDRKTLPDDEPPPPEPVRKKPYADLAVEDDPEDVRLKKRPPPTDVRDTPRPAPVPGGGCLKSCRSTKSSCLSACGQEPNDASQYEAYASCTGKCVSAESRCRLGCN